MVQSNLRKINFMCELMVGVGGGGGLIFKGLRGYLSMYMVLEKTYMAESLKDSKQ